jgi:hypothetical protein
MKKKPASLEALMAGEEGAAHAGPAAAPAPKPKAVEKLTVYVPRAAAKLLKQMALDNDRRVNDYLRDAVNMMLTKHGQPTLEDFENR